RIARDATHLRYNLTPHRNHRTLELYALLVVGLALPDTDPGLAAFALAQLGENLLTDVWIDGVHRECSTDYHCIVLRSFLGGLANARAAGLDLPDGYVDRVSLALDFALHIQRPDGMTPSFSDGDIVDFRQLLALGAELLDRDDLRWAASGGTKGTPPVDVDATFPVGGYLAGRSGWGANAATYGDERFMLMDAGPIGDGGHGHYDQLSIEIYANGHSLVVDPGRYTYADTSWRQWFKGSKAHNTVTVDGLDQTPYRHAAPKGGTSHARLVRRVSQTNFDAIEAEVTSPQHDVVHTRRVLFPEREYWVVHDHLRGDQRHDYEARWHLPSEAEGRVIVERNSGRTRVTTPAGTLTVPASATVEIEPGWISPSYGILECAPIVVVRASGIQADIVTVLSPGESDVDLDDTTERGSLHCVVTRGNTTDLIRWAAHTNVAWERRSS
ncbi:MAG TPA: alginate lyase family protein, partial [Ilumatobacteraceae bacterium]|nr:alginate lyase family protein [Ilumatobacteraceae bacterium]